MTHAPFPLGSDRPAAVVPPANPTEHTGTLGEPADVRRMIESHGLSHTGRVRSVNEDHFVTATLQRSVHLRQTNLDDVHLFDRLSGPRAYLFAVADGVGGSSGGRVASAIAVATIVEYLGEAVGWYNGYTSDHARDFPHHLDTAVHRAHDHLVETFRLQNAGGPATTLTLAMVVWPCAYVVHVGDSRAYHLRGETLRRLTRDQTVGDAMVQYGMPKEQAEQAGLYNMLASAIGARDMTPAVDFISLERGDVLLLCTDGLTDMLSNKIIESYIVPQLKPAAAVQSLFSAAMDAGGRDNITIAIVDIERA